MLLCESELSTLNAHRHSSPFVLKSKNALLLSGEFAAEVIFRFQKNSSRLLIRDHESATFPSVIEKLIKFPVVEDVTFRAVPIDVLLEMS